MTAPRLRLEFAPGARHVPWLGVAMLIASGALLGEHTVVGDLAKYQAVAPLFGEGMHRRKAARLDPIVALTKN